VNELERLLQAFDNAIQTREAAINTGWTNRSPVEAQKMVERARQDILNHVVIMMQLQPAKTQP
jgi:hypothetical protein